MPIKHVIDLQPDDLYVTPAQAQRSQFRRVLGVLDGHVRYSVGGNADRTCKVRTFRRWIRVNNCFTPRHRVTEVWSV